MAHYNKLAHGQWEYPLNEDGNEIAQEQMDALRNENMLSLKQKAALGDYICDCIHDLVVSKPTFDRDFDNHLRCIAQIRMNITKKSYSKWVKQIENRRANGQLQKAKAIRLQTP